jgi:protein CpxP
MKKLILSIALVTGLSALSNAQEATKATATKKENKQNQTPEERAKKGANWAEKKLTLTADQKSQWEVAALKRIMANQPHHEKLKGSTTPEERKELHKQVKANMEAFDVSVNAFLTPEQKTKYEAIKKEKQTKHQAKVKAGKAKADDVDDDMEG